MIARARSASPVRTLVHPIGLLLVNATPTPISVGSAPPGSNRSQHGVAAGAARGVVATGRTAHTRGRGCSAGGGAAQSTPDQQCGAGVVR